MHLDNYLHSIIEKSEGLAISVKATCDTVVNVIDENFDYKSAFTGLLLGNVQSGKTAQMLGLIGALADKEFELFLILTSDNLHLEQQTLYRTRDALATFNVYGESDDKLLRFEEFKKPVIIVLKKNSSVLKRWKNNIASHKLCEGRPIVIFDDEADAASLNTKVNKRDISTINSRLQDIKNLSASSIYIEVTATPQAIILQSQQSNWKPQFVHYFPPGLNYIGGDFIYSVPRSFCIRPTPDNELANLRLLDNPPPEGLKSALLNFLVVCGDFLINGKDTCNFLIHPSVKTLDHENIASKIGEILNDLLILINENHDSFFKEIEKEWKDLQFSKPDIKPLEDVFDKILGLITNDSINIQVLNSNNPLEINYNKGFNIIVGGNSLGRGVTFPALQTVYYCRTAKVPQADTFWQHSRMFGYDRVPGFLRVFIPNSLFNLFANLTTSNKVLIEQISKYGIEGVQLIYPSSIKPTRSNVIDKNALNVLIGGVNFFPKEPEEKNTDKIDELLSNFLDTEEFYSIDSKLVIECLNLVGSKIKEDWNKKKFINCVTALIEKRPSQKISLIVRRNRNITKDTGTLLSPNDRTLGERLNLDTVLTLYRVNGQIGRGWSGNPFWIPNIKFPEGICFYDTDV